MSKSIEVGPLRKNEGAEAARIVRVAFGTFLGVPDPATFMGDRDFMTPRLRSRHVKVIAAREGKRLIGSNVITRWGSFGFFGPLTVLPEYWDRGVAQRLLDVTMTVFEKWGVRHTGLFTFAGSAKHVGLYQKFGYWPRYLTAVMTRAPEEGDLARYTTAALTGIGEGGAKTCAVKFGAARGGAGAGERFDQLLDACEAFAVARGLAIEAGVNLAREDAFRRMRDRGYRVNMQGVAMQRPHAEGFNRPDVWVIDDWR